MLAIIDYRTSDQCKNKKCWFICHKCGKCGRKFKDGIMYDDGTTVSNEGEEEEKK